MTLQSSGSISLSQIQSEFGGNAPISMSEYYKGGTYIPTSGDYIPDKTGSIPSSGQISFSSFYNTSGDALFQFYTYPSYDAGSKFYGNSVTFGWAANGMTTESFSGVYGQAEFPYVWPQAHASTYQVYTTQTGGSAVNMTGGSLNTWVTMGSSDLEWGISTLGNESKTASLTQQFRRVGTTTVLQTIYVYLSCSSYL